jgi:ureidoglycolate lyase
MRTIKIENLSAEAFRPFGSFANHLDPAAGDAGGRPVQFTPDLVQQGLGKDCVVSFSTCRVEKRPWQVDFAEYHSVTCEGILPLDNDILIHVGPASHPRAGAPVDKFRIFRVPRGTMVVLRPGVWHGAPFTTNDKPANVLIVLPERTYANDCEFVPLPAKDQVQFEA